MGAIKFWAGVIGLGLSCCSAARARPSLTYTVAVDPGFSAEQTDDVLSGISCWTDSIPELRVTVVVSNCTSASNICIRPDHTMWNSGPIGDQLGHTDIIYSAIGGTPVLYVDRIATLGSFMDPRALLRLTATHEFGHALGIINHDQPGNLMAADAHDQSLTLTAVDLDAFWSVRQP